METTAATGAPDPKTDQKPDSKPNTTPGATTDTKPEAKRTSEDSARSSRTGWVPAIILGIPCLTICPCQLPAARVLSVSLLLAPGLLLFQRLFLLLFPLLILNAKEIIH